MILLSRLARALWIETVLKTTSWGNTMRRGSQEPCKLKLSQKSIKRQIITVEVRENLVECNISICPQNDEKGKPLPSQKTQA